MCYYRITFSRGPTTTLLPSKYYVQTTGDNNTFRNAAGERHISKRYINIMGEKRSSTVQYPYFERFAWKLNREIVRTGRAKHATIVRTAAVITPG